MPGDDDKPIGRIPLVTMADVQRELTSLKSRVTELESANRRLLDDWKHERSDTLEAIKRYVGPAVTGLGERFAKFEASQQQSLAILQESREWVKLGLEGKKIDTQVDADVVKIMADQRVRTRTAILVFLGVVATAAASIITALATSHVH